MNKTAILGAGGWAIALAICLRDNRQDVTLWSAVPAELDEIEQYHQRDKVLPGIQIPADIKISRSLDFVSACRTVIIATASFAVRSVARRLKPFLAPDAIVVNVSKGLESDTLKRPSECICEELPGVLVVSLSGPSHAEEVARQVPTTLVAASDDPKSAEAVQDLFMSTFIRVYTSDDITGVELGGALKNIIALAAGICDGLELGDNPKAALMTRGITEMARLGVAMGGHMQTFAGLTGIGDLIVTCTSMHSRNRRAGILIGKGMQVSEAIQQIGMTVEGYTAAKSAWELSRKIGVDMPIIDAIYAVLYKGVSPSAAIHKLMTRRKKHEMEDAWFY